MLFPMNQYHIVPEEQIMGRKYFDISKKRSHRSALCLSIIGFYPQIIPNGMYKDPKLTLNTFEN
jgi:hypothetical protein